MKRRPPLVIGSVYGRLTVLGPADDYVQPSGHKKRRVKCQCSCGKETVAHEGHVATGHTRSCGCLDVDTVIARSLTHGSARRGKITRTYLTWCDMKKRCLNPEATGYPNYGGRGIIICDRWLNSFENFLEDMGEKPPGSMIERKNNDGPYTEDNCRWATRREQNNNRRNNRWFEHDGKRMTIAQWEQFMGWKRGGILNRLRQGWSFTKAICTPIRAHKEYQYSSAAEVGP